MVKRLGRTFRLSCGFALIGIGLLGLVLPVVPGIPLLIAGVALVGDHRWVRPVVERVRRRRAVRGRPDSRA